MKPFTFISYTLLLALGFLSTAANAKPELIRRQGGGDSISGHRNLQSSQDHFEYSNTLGISDIQIKQLFDVFISRRHKTLLE
jgi:hypothetical protein